MRDRYARFFPPRSQAARQTRDDQTHEHHQRGGKQMGNTTDPDYHPGRDRQQRADRLDDIVIKRLCGVLPKICVGRCAHVLILGEGDRLTNLFLLICS